MTMEFFPTTGTIGADVEGVDLGQPLTEETASELEAALNKYKVLFFRDQHGLTPASQAAFARLFGEVETHPVLNGVEGYPEVALVVADGDPSGEDTWHADNTFLPEPSMASILRA